MIDKNKDACEVLVGNKNKTERPSLVKDKLRKNSINRNKNGTEILDKNQESSTKKIRIYTYNTQTLRLNDKLHELLEELKYREWDIVGIGEVRRRGEGLINIQGTDIDFYYNGGEGRIGGTGFLINGSKMKNITIYKSYSHRVSKLVWKMKKEDGGGRLKLIQVYAPTSNSDENEVEEFYNHLQLAVNEDRCKYTIVMGDMNSKVGCDQDSNVVGKHGYGQRNERGVKLIEFAEANQFFIMNTFFKKIPEKKYTWVSPDGVTRNEIDYFLSDRKNIFLDVETDSKIDVGSDHKAVRAVLKLEVKKKYNESNNNKSINNTRTLQLDEEEIERFQNTFKSNLNNMSLAACGNIDSIEESIVSALHNAANLAQQEMLNKTDKIKKYLPRNIRRLFEKRRKAKKKGDANAIKERSKELREALRSWSKDKKINKLRETVEKGTSIKQYWKNQKLGKNHIIAMKDENNEINYNQDAILDIICSFYEKLYRCEEQLDVNEIENDKRNYREEINNKFILPILKEEIQCIINKLKKGKATGPDKITNEMLKYGGEILVQHLQKLFNLCLEKGKVPKTWLKADLILLFKKGDHMNISNYRPLSLLSCIYKLFMSVITKRIDSKLEQALSYNQTGFRKNFSTLDNILSVKLIMRSAQEYMFSLIIIFVDFEKAYDTMFRNKIIESLVELQVDDEFIDIFKYIFKDTSLDVKIGKKKKSIQMQRGVRQGDVSSCKTFVSTLELSTNKLEWDGYGIKVNGEWLNRLGFVDDYILICKSKEEAKRMLKDLEAETSKVGLKINAAKSKYMMFNIEDNIELSVGGIKLEKVSQYVFLGQLISEDNDSEDKEVRRRIGLAWASFNKYKHLFRSEVDMVWKRKLWNMCVLPVLTYGAETWVLNSNTLNKIRVTQRSMERSMLRISRRERKTNEWVRKQTGLDDIVGIISERKWGWTGHIVRTEDGRWSKRLIQWYPRDRNRSRGRPRQRWDEEMRRICGQETWQRVARDRKEWARMGQVCKKELILKK